MPITQLDPKPALIIIDLQKGIVAIPTAHPTSEIVSNSAKLAQAFRQRNFPVVLVNVTAAAPGRTDAGPHNFNFPPDWADLVPELNPQPSDILISKKRVGAFIGTTLHDQLQSLGVTQLFLTGIATSAGVESTLRSARDHGYNTVVITDAVTDRDPQVHQHCIEKIFPRFAETGTTQNLLSLLKP